VAVADNDGDDAIRNPRAVIESEPVMPRRLNAVKRGIGKLHGERGFLLADLARHGWFHRRNDG
jgi:hypothetical protein